MTHEGRKERKWTRKTQTVQMRTGKLKNYIFFQVSSLLFLSCERTRRTTSREILGLCPLVNTWNMSWLSYLSSFCPYPFEYVVSLNFFSTYLYYWKDILQESRKSFLPFTTLHDRLLCIRKKKLYGPHGSGGGPTSQRLPFGCSPLFFGKLVIESTEDEYGLVLLKSKSRYY